MQRAIKEVYEADFSLNITTQEFKAKDSELSKLHYKRKARIDHPELFERVDIKSQAEDNAKALGNMYGMKFTVLTMCPELDRQMGEMLGI